MRKEVSRNVSPYLWILGLGHLIVDLAQGILPVLAPVLAQSFHLSYFQVGTVALAFTCSSAIIQPVFGVLSDRYIMPWLMPLGLLLSGLGLALTGVVNSYGLLLLAVLLSGIGVAAYHPEGSKVAHYVSDAKRAGSSMAVFSVGGNLGFGLGPLLATLVLSIAGQNAIPALMIPGVLAALAFLFLLPRFTNILAGKLIRKQEHEEKAAPGCGRLGSLTLLLLYVTTRSWIQSGLVYFIPFYFPHFRGIAEPEYLVSTFLIAGAVGTIVGGPFADRFGGRNGMVGSMLAALITVYPFLHLDGGLLPVLAFIAGAGLVSTFSTTVVYGQRLFPHNIGLASGLLLGFGVGMGSIGVTLLGAIADRFGLPITMGIISLLPAVGILLALVLPDEGMLRQHIES